MKYLRVVFLVVSLFARLGYFLPSPQQEAVPSHTGQDEEAPIFSQFSNFGPSSSVTQLATSPDARLVTSGEHQEATQPPDLPPSQPDDDEPVVSVYEQPSHGSEQESPPSVVDTKETGSIEPVHNSPASLEDAFLQPNYIQAEDSYEPSSVPQVVHVEPEEQPATVQPNIPSATKESPLPSLYVQPEAPEHLPSNNISSPLSFIEPRAHIPPVSLTMPAVPAQPCPYIQPQILPEFPSVEPSSQIPQVPSYTQPITESKPSQPTYFQSDTFQQSVRPQAPLLPSYVQPEAPSVPSLAPPPQLPPAQPETVNGVPIYSPPSVVPQLPNVEVKPQVSLYSQRDTLPLVLSAKPLVVVSPDTADQVVYGRPAADVPQQSQEDSGRPLSVFRPSSYNQHDDQALPQTYDQVPQVQIENGYDNVDIPVIDVRAPFPNQHTDFQQEYTNNFNIDKNSLYRASSSHGTHQFDFRQQPTAVNGYHEQAQQRPDVSSANVYNHQHNIDAGTPITRPQNTYGNHFDVDVRSNHQSPGPNHFQHDVRSQHQALIGPNHFQNDYHSDERSHNNGFHYVQENRGKNRLQGYGK